MAAARGYGLDELGEQLWINSRDQSPQFRLDNPEHLAEMTAALRARQPVLIILDVLNVLHGADENDAGEMRGVLDKLNVIHQETGASLCVLHHFNKMDKGSMTSRLRGSSAIAGWAEFLVGIAGEENPRKVSFELKAAAPPENVFFRIQSGEGKATIELVQPDEVHGARSRLQLLEKSEGKAGKPRSAVEELLSDGAGRKTKGVVA